MTEVERLQRIADLRALRSKVDIELRRLSAELPQPKPRRPKARAAQCGTDTGYYRHIRTLSEPACDECKAAHSRYEAERAKRARKAAA